MPVVKLQSEQSEFLTLISDMWTHFIKSKAKTGSKMLNEYLTLSGFFFFLYGAIYIVIYLSFCNTLCNKKNFAFSQMKRT